MTRTSRLRRLHVVEPSSETYEPYEPSSYEPSSYEPSSYERSSYEPSSYEPSSYEPQEPSPATDSEVLDNADRADLDAALTGMSMLLRLALRLMKSYGASPSQRDRGR